MAVQIGDAYVSRAVSAGFPSSTQLLKGLLLVLLFLLFSLAFAKRKKEENEWDYQAHDTVQGGAQLM